jgi:hypothetical protein
MSALTLMASYFKMRWRRSAWIVLCSFITVTHACAADTKQNDVLQVSLKLHGGAFASQPLPVTVEIKNLSGADRILPADISPEGWMLRLRIRDHAGKQVYVSGTAKVEMTAAKLNQLLTLKPKESYTANIDVPALLPPGDYEMTGTFSTRAFEGRGVAGLPIGTWDTQPLKLTIK